MGLGKVLKKIWHFIWYEDSIASWIINVLLAFILVKFVIYPGIGIAFATEFPIVAVVSGSMEHEINDFDEWWDKNGNWYEDRNLTYDIFNEFKYKNGFNKGDIMFLKGVSPKNIKVGDVLVYEITSNRNPIIHRVVEVRNEGQKYVYVTKGDNNNKEDRLVRENQISRTGKAFLRLPYLGWIKIWFVNLFRFGI